MPFFPWRLDVGGITTSTGTASLMSALTAMRPLMAVALQFLDEVNIQPVTPAGILIKCIVKAKGVFDGASLVPDVVFTLDSAAKIYRGNVDFNVTEINDLFHVDADITNDVSPVELGMGFVYSLDSGVTWIPSNNIALTLQNNIARGTEGAPATLPGPTDWQAIHGQLFLPAVVDYTGGGSTKLDGWQLTAGLSVPRNYFFSKPGSGYQLYMLRAGTDAEASPGIIRPDDYDGTTNQLVYEKQG